MKDRLLVLLLLAVFALPVAAQPADRLHTSIAAIHHVDRDSLGHPTVDLAPLKLEVQKAAAEGLAMAAALPAMLRMAAESVDAAEMDYLSSTAYRAPRLLRLINTVSIVGPLVGTGLLIAGETDAATSLALSSASVAGIGGLLSLREDGRARRADAADDARRARSRAGRAVLTAEFLALAHALEHLNDDAQALAEATDLDPAAFAKLAHLGGDLLGGDLLMVNSLAGEAGHWLNDASMEVLGPTLQEMARVRGLAGEFLPMLPMAREAASGHSMSSDSMSGH
ncbi:MAG: hypothetical protein HKN29_11670 [Rhodothermales bacterium]|nr:hypothetical protein [Rhodothermales bacterium]